MLGLELPPLLHQYWYFEMCPKKAGCEDDIIAGSLIGIGYTNGLQTKGQSTTLREYHVRFLPNLVDCPRNDWWVVIWWMPTFSMFRQWPKRRIDPQKRAFGFRFVEPYHHIKDILGWVNTIKYCCIRIYVFIFTIYTYLNELDSLYISCIFFKQLKPNFHRSWEGTHLCNHDSWFNSNLSVCCECPRWLKLTLMTFIPGCHKTRVTPLRLEGSKAWLFHLEERRENTLR